MAEDRIDIVVDDKVDANVEKKIRAIGTASEKGFTSLQKLKKALGDINVSSVSKLADASAKVTNSLAREMNAQARLTAVRDRSSLADAKAAINAQKLATETAKAEAAQTRAAAAALRLQASQDRMAAATERAAAKAAALKASQDALQAELDQTNQKLTSGVTYMERYAAAMAKTATAKAGPSIMPGVGHLPPGGFKADPIVEQLNNVGKAAKGNGHHVANIAAQMNDLGVQFSMAAASGEPLKMVFMALIQQGSQLSYIASTMQGGWKGVALIMGQMLLKLAPLIAAFGLGYLALSKFNSELTKDAGIKEYVKSLGLTEKELKKLEGQHITMTDTLKAVWTELSNNLLSSMGLTTDEISSFWNDVSNNIVYFMKAAFIGIAGYARALWMTIKTIGENIQIIFHNAGVGAANVFLLGMQKLYNGSIKIVNLLASGMNTVFGTTIEPMKEMNLGIANLSSGMKEMKGVDFWGEFQTGAQNSLNTMNRIGDRAAKNAKERLAAQAKELKAERGAGPKGSKPAVDNTAERRSHALDMVNLKLDDELKRMKLLKDERAIAQRMDQIEQELAQKKIKLNDAERRSIEGKVKAIEDFKYVQSEMDRIYEETVAPLRTLNAAQEAAHTLAEKQVITQEQLGYHLAMNQRRYEESINPLFGLEEAMSKAENAVTLYGEAMNQANYYDQIRAAFLDKQIILSPQYIAGLNAEVDAMMRRNAELQKAQLIQSTVAGIVDPMLQERSMIENKAAMYAEIDRLRRNDTLKEQEAQRAKYALDAKFSEMRLSGAKSFFGEMAGLQSSNVKELAAIGKAAAIAQATIDGYVAVQKALASAPPPWNFALAAAVAVKTGMQVAGIASTNVGSFATGGQFMVDGRGGVDNNNINMNVSRGERVTIETPKQQRENASGEGQAPIDNRLKIVNVLDKSEILAALESDEGERLVVNIMNRNPKP